MSPGDRLVAWLRPSPIGEAALRGSLFGLLLWGVMPLIVGGTWTLGDLLVALVLGLLSFGSLVLWRRRDESRP